MLFSDVTHRHLFAFAVGDGNAEDAFTQEDPLAVVPKTTMPEIREVGFGLINYVDKGLYRPPDMTTERSGS